MSKKYFFCLETTSVIFTSNLVSLQSTPRERLLSDVVGGLLLSSVNPLDFHAIRLLLLVIFLNTYELAEILNNWCLKLFNFFLVHFLVHFFR